MHSGQIDLMTELSEVASMEHRERYLFLEDYHVPVSLT